MTLVKEHKGKWYVFVNINAEAWDEKGKNILSISHANGIYNSRDEAYQAAKKLDEKEGEWGGGTEYGVQFERLCKDGTTIKLTK